LPDAVDDGVSFLLGGEGKAVFHNGFEGRHGVAQQVCTPETVVDQAQDVIRKRLRACPRSGRDNGNCFPLSAGLDISREFGAIAIVPTLPLNEPVIAAGVAASVAIALAAVICIATAPTPTMDDLTTFAAAADNG
jgi:hypothetical protein